MTGLLGARFSMTSQLLPLGDERRRNLTKQVSKRAIKAQDEPSSVAISTGMPVHDKKANQTFNLKGMQGLQITLQKGIFVM